jgi:two-component system chemotaxis response regulator CheB
MPPMFTASLAQRLTETSPVPTVEARDGLPLVPGHAYVAPGDWHLEVEARGMGLRARLHQAAPQLSCRPSVDVLFDSIARPGGPRALALVLTGMGQDGLRGCRALRERGAEIWVQDEASSVVWGMPGNVARAGLASRILPIGRIGPELAARVAAPVRLERRCD